MYQKECQNFIKTNYGDAMRAIKRTLQTDTVFCHLEDQMIGALLQKNIIPVCDLLGIQFSA